MNNHNDVFHIEVDCLRKLVDEYLLPLAEQYFGVSSVLEEGECWLLKKILIVTRSNFDLCLSLDLRDPYLELYINKRGASGVGVPVNRVLHDCEVKPSYFVKGAVGDIDDLQLRIEYFGKLLHDYWECILKYFQG